MMFLHSILGFLHTAPGKVLCVGTVIVDSMLAFLAVDGGVGNNNALVLVAIFGNITVLIGVGITGWFQLKAARIGAARFELLKPLVELPAKVTKLAEGIDGVAHELKAAKEEGSIAKADAAFQKGKLEERDDEIGRQGAAALAKEKDKPTEVIVGNTPDNPANVKPVK